MINKFNTLEEQKKYAFPVITRQDAGEEEVEHGRLIHDMGLFSTSYKRSLYHKKKKNEL